VYLLCPQELPTVYILSQVNSVLASQHYMFKIHFNIIVPFTHTYSKSSHPFRVLMISFLWIGVWFRWGKQHNSVIPFRYGYTTVWVLTARIVNKGTSFSALVNRVSGKDCAWGVSLQCLNFLAQTWDLISSCLSQQISFIPCVCLQTNFLQASLRHHVSRTIWLCI
jgi:hypothetical protein